ncbi:MAG: hypothetical protein IT436_00505 [Phycisphaerales bacterium]|nr:hypothetical protein [Phycisphaerales bacterium]
MNNAGRMVRRGCGWGIAAAVVACAGGEASGQVIADSMADFSSTQGFRGWSYGFCDGDPPTPFQAGDFELLPNFDATFPPGVWIRALGVGGYWTAINRTAAHPNAVQSVGGRLPQENWAVRRWVSPGQMPVRIRGHIADAGPGGGDGVMVKIIVDGALRYQHSFADGDTTGVDYSFDACLNAGDIVDFILAPGPATDQSDGTIFTAVIEGPITEQPESEFACAGGAASFHVAAGGAGPFRYQWRRDGVDLDGATTPTLVVDPVGPGDVGVYTCVVSVFACGSVESDPATLSICAVDYNCDGFVDFADYLEFLSLYDGQDPRADLNQDGFVDFADYLEFVNQFNGGC